MTRSYRVPQIEYLRAIAVVAVILDHLDVLPSGFLGVDIFFVISGFVISQALWEADRGSFVSSLKHFYYRRIIRIIPPLAVNAIDVVHSGVSGNNGGYHTNPLALEGLPNESSS